MKATGKRFARPQTAEVELEERPTKTKVHLMINTNKHYSEQQLASKKRVFGNIIDDWADRGLEFTVGQDYWIQSVDLAEESALEVGGKFGRLHAHLVLTITHYVHKYSVPKLRERVKEWLDQNGRDLATSWNVFFRKDNSTYRFENYASKVARKRMSDRKLEEASQSMKGEYYRLVDDDYIEPREELQPTRILRRGEPDE